MEAAVASAFKWGGIGGMVLALCLFVWVLIASRRSAQPLPSAFSSLVILALGGMMLGVSNVFAGPTRIFMVWIGSVFVAFAGGRMWERIKRQIGSSGSVKPTT